MTSRQNRGGRIPPDNRATSAPGVGKNSKRHDLERRNTPFLHDSDLQQGDVQAFEQGQRVTKKQTQQPASGGQRRGQGGGRKRGGGLEAPDPIDFIGGRSQGGPAVPSGFTHNDDNIRSWLPFARHLVTGPNSSGMLAGAYINQLRNLLRSGGNGDAEVINLNDVDDAMGAIVNGGR